MNTSLLNIQIIDDANNATYSVFQATPEEYALIFPGKGQDIETVESFARRAGSKVANETLRPLWDRPILKSQAMGIHGTLYYVRADRRKALPRTKREIDWPDSAINGAQRALFAKARADQAG